MEAIGNTEYTNQAPHKFCGCNNMFKFNIQEKYQKISKLHKIRGENFQYVRNQYASFELKGMKTVGVSDNTMQTPPKVV